MPPLDLVIIKPGSQKKLYGQLSDFQLTGLEPPLWGALLTAFLRQRGYGVELLDAELEGWDWPTTARMALEAAPRLVLISVSGSNPSASTPNMIGAGRIAGHLKEMSPQTRVVLGGLHPSALPERTLREEKADYVCQGEGFATLPGLIEALRAGREPRGVPGLWQWQDGQLVAAPRPEPWPDLDSLPRPAWDVLPLERYRAHNWHCFDSIQRRQPYAVLYTSLGCPFNCGFCCINSLFGRRGIRLRAPEQVLAEVDFLVERWGVRNIKIIDEMFALDQRRVEAICNPLIERGYDLNMWAYARVDTVTPAMLRTMKKAGINWVAYGFESGSSRVLKDVTKGYAHDKVGQVVRMTQDEGLYICANYILGLPEDDMESMAQTLDMALEINAEWANIYCTMAYPGSRLHEQALAAGWPLPRAWSGYSQYAYDCQPLPTRHLGPAQVLGFRDQAFQTYYHRPAYLEMMARRFGAPTAEHIRRMARHRLARRLLGDPSGPAGQDAPPAPSAPTPGRP